MLRIAHRGASGYEVENTLSAFKTAIELGVDMVELDIRTCKTGESLVIHDKYIRSKNIQLKDLTLSDIKKVHIEGDEKIPTLKEALQMIPKHVKVNIDIKDTKAVREVVLLIQEEIKKGRTYSDFIVATYNLWTIFTINKMDSRIPTSLLIFFLPTVLIRLASRFHNTASVELEVKHVSKKTLDLAHQFGLQVFAWVANNPDEIRRLKQMKVDGIITDFPDRI